MRRIIGLALVAVAFMFAAATADAANTSTNIKGTYGFMFSGGSAITNAAAVNCGDDCQTSTRASGTGIFYADGKGNILGGTVWCSQSLDTEDFAQEWEADIIGGQYQVLQPGYGFMYWQFDVESPGHGPDREPINGFDGFCTSEDEFIDFTFTLVQSNGQMLFAVSSFTDGDDSESEDEVGVDDPAGQWKNVSGVAFRNSTAVGLPK